MKKIKTRGARLSRYEDKKCPTKTKTSTVNKPPKSIVVPGVGTFDRKEKVKES